MKLQTSLTADEVREALARAQASGDVPGDIEFDQFNPAGSRSHRFGWDVHLATERKDTRADGTVRPTAAYYGVRGQLRAATYDEYGAFLAEVFSADENAHARPYKGKDDFHRKTNYDYATRDDMPSDAPTRELEADTRPTEPEPEPEYASTAPVTHAMLSPDEMLSQIDDALAGCWVNTRNP
jgi:hypothetical protein